MEEQKVIENIVEKFKTKAEEYSKKFNADNFSVEQLYQKGKEENGHAYVMGIMEFKDFFLKLNYRVHAPMLLPSSTLEMRILFKGGKLPI